MISTGPRLALLFGGDRLFAAAVRGHRVETFTVEAEQPAPAVRAELDARKLRVRNVAIGLPRGSVTVKPIELPEVGGELGDMVRFELDRHLPFAADDAAFDFIPLAPNGQQAGGARRVLVAAADRRLLDAALRLTQEAALRPTSVTVAAHELASLVRPARGSHVAWAHRTGADVELLLLASGTLEFSRHITAADDAAVADEIRRSLAVVRWRGLDAVWLSGDSVAPGAPATTRLTALGVPIMQPPYTPRAAALLANANGESRGLEQLAIAVAAGKRTRTLDLLPPHLKPRRLTRGQLLTIGTGVLALALVVTALVAPGYRERQRLAALNSEVARLEPEVRAVEQIQRELERRRTLLGTMRSVEAAALKPLPVLRELTDLLPNDAWLTLLSLDAKGVELTGQAAAASNLIPVLENSPRFERAEFASPVTRGRDREQFRILAKWEPGGASAAAPAAPAPGTPAAVPPGAGAPRQARPAAPPGPGPAAPGAPVQPRQAPPSAAAQPAQPPPAIGPRQLPPDEDSVLTPESPPPRRPVQSLPRVRQ